MAWMESHQELGSHPKLHKLARLLEVSRPTAVGHLHYFWWWAMDYAEDGNITRFDALDLAVAGQWEGEPEAFVESLIEARFVDDYGAERWIHDWDEYFGRVIAQRKANADRQREWRERHKGETSSSTARNGDITVTEQSRTGATVPNLTRPDRTKPTETNVSGVTPNAAFVLFQAFCEERSIDEADVSKSMKSKQITIAARIAKEYSEADLRGCIRYLSSQSWRTSPWDLSTVASEIGKWAMAGRPEIEPPKKTNGNQFGSKGPDAAWFAAQARDLERQGR